jgi:hypothetical protein
MCRRADCSRCGRPTYAGCGAHVEQVLGSVPPDERCRCRQEKAQDAEGEDRVAGRSWLRDLLGE